MMMLRLTTVITQTLTSDSPLPFMDVFQIPEGVTQMKPYASCNKHGVWGGHRVLFHDDL